MDRAYYEKGAAASLIFWKWKLLQATGHPRYTDPLEGLCTTPSSPVSVSAARSYFYANPLEVRAEQEAHVRVGVERGRLSLRGWLEIYGIGKTAADGTLTSSPLQSEPSTTSPRPPAEETPEQKIARLQA